MPAENSGPSSDGMGHLTQDLGSLLSPESFRFKGKNNIFPVCVYGKGEGYKNSALKRL